MTFLSVVRKVLVCAAFMGVLADLSPNEVNLSAPP